MTLQTIINSKAIEVCPVCLTTDSLEIIERSPHPSWTGYIVRCRCGLESSRRHTIPLAVAAWNVGAIRLPAERIGCACTAPDNPTEPITRESRAVRHANR